MRLSSLFVLAVGFAFFSAAAASVSAADAPYENSFDAAEVGKMPEGFMVLSGDFAVGEDGGNKFLELPGAPLDTFGVLFGPSQSGEVAASARFFGTKQGRKFPTFGLSLGGANSFRLQVSPGKKALELYQGDAVQVSVPFEWQPGTWTKLTIEARKSGGGWLIEGSAASSEKKEEAVRIQFVTKEALPAGRAGIWGSPFAGTPVRFDDLRSGPAPQK